MATNQEHVNKAVTLLHEGLAPFVAAKLEMNVQDVPSLADLKPMAKDSNLKKPIGSWDVLLLLRVIEEADRFNKTLGRLELSLVSELRVWRNRWAHQFKFPTADTERALDSAERLLKSINAPQADEVGRIRRELRHGDLAGKATPNRVGRTTAGAGTAQNDGSKEPAEVLREVRSDRHQSWSNLRKAVRALMEQPHEPFGTPNVANSSKSTVRLMQRRTGLSLDRLRDMLDSM